MMELAVREAEECGDQAALAHACFVLDQVLSDLGQLDEPANSRRAAEIYEKLGDERGKAAAYNEMGIAACKFGLGGGRWKFRSEQIDIEGIYQAAQVYACAALEICNWDKPRTLIIKIDGKQVVQMPPLPEKWCEHISVSGSGQYCYNGQDTRHWNYCPKCGRVNPTKL
jgi:hypothetical protein